MCGVCECVGQEADVFFLTAHSFAECQDLRHSTKKIPFFYLKNFAECQVLGTRQIIKFAECHGLIGTRQIFFFDFGHQFFL